jgi:tricorn protease
VLTKLGAGFRYPPQWSPDSKKIAFADQKMKLRVIDVASGALTDVDQGVQWFSHPALEAWRFQWSADSRWLTWARPPRGTGNNAIYVFDTKNNTKTQVTSAYMNDQQPTFDPGGKFLYYASDRTFAPIYSTFDSSWTYANSTDYRRAAPQGREVAVRVAERRRARKERRCPGRRQTAAGG